MYKRTKQAPASAQVEAVGWYGMAAVLLAYAATSFGRISPDSYPYILLNGTGALALAYHSYVKKDQQPFVLNFVWLAIALFGAFGFARS